MQKNNVRRTKKKADSVVEEKLRSFSREVVSPVALHAIDALATAHVVDKYLREHDPKYTDYINMIQLMTSADPERMEKTREFRKGLRRSTDEFDPRRFGTDGN